MSSVDWAAINEKLPFERTDEAKEKRRELFKQFDPNGNGYLSLAEVKDQDGHEVFKDSASYNDTE